MRRRELLSGVAALAACGGEPSEPAPPSQPSCTPLAPSPADEHAAAHDPGSARIARAEAIAARFMADNPPEQMIWDWGEGVVMYALSELYRVSANPALRDYVKAWLDTHIEAGYGTLIVSSDRCPPALSAMVLHAETCDERYREIVLAVLRYLDEEALRTPDGGINHLGSIDLFPPSLWLDSLFMFGNVWARWAELTGEGAYLDQLAEQYRIFAGHLAHESGWLLHAHAWELAEQDPEVFWARGNGWVTAAGYEYLRIRRARGESDAEVEAMLAKQVEAIVAAQDPSGLFWTVVNRPGESYLETSGTALFAAGMARGYRVGLLDPSVLPVIELAMDGIATQIIDEPAGPIVTGISGPTTVGDFEHYAAIEVGDNIHYGVGAVILALIETSGL